MSTKILAEKSYFSHKFFTRTCKMIVKNIKDNLQSDPLIAAFRLSYFLYLIGNIPRKVHQNFPKQFVVLILKTSLSLELITTSGQKLQSRKTSREAFIRSVKGWIVAWR